jgi:DNA-binding GntR family transcriptional regulator
VNAVSADGVRTASLADEIAFRIQSDILDGRIGLGERLAQDELCARFGVSRTPVREALMKLHATNLVSLRPNRGAVVRVPERREVHDAYQLRAELEGFAAELASMRPDRLMVRRLHGAQRELADLVAGVDPRSLTSSDEPEFNAAIAASNDAFHDLILTAADNRALGEVVLRLRGFFPKDYVTHALESVDQLLTLNVEQHEEIAAAIASGAKRKARRAMEDHVAHAGRLLLEYLDRQCFWG